MSDPSLDLQGAIVSALKALATEAGDRVYDTVPAVGLMAIFPYIVVGAGQTVPVEETCWDRSQCFHQIDIWSREVGFPQAKRLAGALRDALNDGDMVVPGQILDRMSVRSIDYSRDPDGLTSRARLLLVTETQPA